MCARQPSAASRPLHQSSTASGHTPQRTLSGAHSSGERAAAARKRSERLCACFSVTRVGWAEGSARHPHSQYLPSPQRNSHFIHRARKHRQSLGHVLQPRPPESEFPGGEVRKFAIQQGPGGSSQARLGQPRNTAKELLHTGLGRC